MDKFHKPRTHKDRTKYDRKDDTTNNDIDGFYDGSFGIDGTWIPFDKERNGIKS